MNKNVMDDEELQRIMRAAQAVRMGMNMHAHDTRPGPSFFDVFVKTFVWIIIGLLIIGIFSDKIMPYIGPYLKQIKAYEEAHHVN